MRCPVGHDLEEQIGLVWRCRGGSGSPARVATCLRGNKMHRTVRYVRDRHPKIGTRKPWVRQRLKPAPLPWNSRADNGVIFSKTVETSMETILIIVLLILLLGGGGWYGRGRWYGRRPL